MINLDPKEVGQTYNEASNQLRTVCKSPSFLVLLSITRKNLDYGAAFGCKINFERIREAYQDKFEGTGLVPWNRNFVLFVGKISARIKCLALLCI